MKKRRKKRKKTKNKPIGTALWNIPECFFHAAEQDPVTEKHTKVVHLLVYEIMQKLVDNGKSILYNTLNNKPNTFF